ncbi:MAG TPA: CBS domain-containing protein, partial [Clostridia bacterium]
CQELKDRLVKDIMRTDVVMATPETTVLEIAADFLKNDLYIVPVVENDKAIGIVTRSEIKTALAKGMDLKK